MGSCSINGSITPIVKSHEPKEYIGVDMSEGNFVDKVVNATDLVKEFGKESFDMVINCEMLEHAEEWQDVINNMKDVLKVGGYLVTTTRSPGFAYHPFPVDCWRYTKEDMAKIFSDFEIIVNKDDPECLGVFVIAKKKSNKKASLEGIELALPPR